MCRLAAARSRNTLTHTHTHTTTTTTYTNQTTTKQPNKQTTNINQHRQYSNGFCHWPRVAWRRSDGTWHPAHANFTSLATPSAPGSGRTALATLLHEGGHAAHFASVDQRSPLCSQERAPTSVA